MGWWRKKSLGGYQTTLRYWLASPKRAYQQGSSLRLTWRIEGRIKASCGFSLRADQEGIPSSLRDGVELFRWSADKSHAGRTHKSWVDLQPIRQRGWVFFFCRAIPLQASGAATVLFIHPDTCVPVAEDGRIQTRGVGEDASALAMNGRITCPYDFREFTLGQALFAFSEAERPSRAYAFCAGEMDGRHVRVPMDIYGRFLGLKYCPLGHRLPFSIEVFENLIFGVVGGQGSGKNAYLTALINYLSTYARSDWKINVAAATNDTYEKSQQFVKELFVDQNPSGTFSLDDWPPMIYEFLCDQDSRGKKRKRRLNVSFHNAPGQVFQDRSRVIQEAAYLGSAHGIVFVVNPLTFPKVREALPGFTGLPDSKFYVPPQQIIGNIFDVIEKGRGVARGGASVPLALVLTNCDALRDTGLLEDHRLWGTDWRHAQGFDVDAHQDMTGMMGEFMRRWAPEGYHNITRRFKRHAFFGTSIVRSARVGRHGRRVPIAPWRVEDSFLWLLAELGIVPVRRSR